MTAVIKVGEELQALNLRDPRVVAGLETVSTKSDVEDLFTRLGGSY